MRWLLVLVVVGCGSQQPRAQPIQVFDPPKPVLRLPRHFTPVSYTATLAIDPAAPGFTGHVEIAGTLDRAAAVIWLNARELTIVNARAYGALRSTNGHEVKVTVHDELLELRAPFAAGPVTLVLDYEGKIAPASIRGIFRNEHRGTPYVYTYAEPIHARSIFPSLDEPDRKTTWSLAIETPKPNLAVSNTAAISTTPLSDGRTRTQFATTKPLPTYLVAFGVGPFEIVDAGKTRAGIPLRFVVPNGEGPRTAYAASALPRIVDILTAYFDVPFPYDKLDILVAPTLADGAMEHAGLVTSDGANVLLDRQPSWRQRRNVVITLGHEASHQWFGDLVTPAWFDDTWLKEGFATWMEYKVTTAFEPAWHDERSVISRRNQAFNVDVQAAARVVRQQLERADQIQGTFDTMSYTKGAAIITVLERHVGEEPFRRALGDYFRQYAHGVAAFDQFIASLERSTGKRLAPLASSFLDQAGVPILDVKLACDGGGAKLAIAQQRLVLAGTAPAHEPWHIPICVAHEQAGKRAETCGVIDAVRGELALPVCPTWWMANAGGAGYYYTAVGAAEVEALRDRAWPALTSSERRALFEDVRVQVMRGALPARMLMSLVPKLVEAGDRHSVGDALGDPSSGDLDGGGHGLPNGLELALTPELVPTLAAWVQKQFGPLARARGFTPSATESIDDEATRRALIRTVGRTRDAALVKQAVALAARYRELPESTRSLVLPIAVNADVTLADRLRADAVAEPERTLRISLLQALSTIEEPQRARVLDVLLDAKVTAEDAVFGLLRGSHSHRAMRQISTWLRANVKAMLGKFSPEDQTFAFILVFGVFTCDAAERDTTVTFLRDTFGNVPHAEKALQQQTERIDQCIALRAVVAPSVREWLRTAR